MQNYNRKLPHAKKLIYIIIKIDFDSIYELQQFCTQKEGLFHYEILQNYCKSTYNIFALKI